MSKEPGSPEEEVDENVLICAPVEGTSPLAMVHGTAVTQCHVCRVNVFIAPSGQEFVERETVTVLCNACGLIAIGEEERKEGKPVEMHVLPESRKEIRNWFLFQTMPSQSDKGGEGS